MKDIIDVDLKMRVNELHNCIYCMEKLPVTDKEHIFNSCWGGEHKTGQIICKRCNEHFSKIDGCLRPFTKYIMNAQEFKGQRHKAIPVIKTTNGTTIESGGKPKKESKITITELENDSASIRIIANGKGEARRLFMEHKEQIEDKIKRTLTDKEVDAIHKQISTSHKINEYVGPLEITEEITPISIYRSTVHTLIKCIAMYYPEIAISNDLRAAKEFAYHGKGGWTKYAINEATPVGTSILEDPNLKENVKCNAAEIYFSKSLGKIIGHLKILGLINIWVELSDSYVGPDRILDVIEKVKSREMIKGIGINFPFDMGPLIDKF
ncbi:HNH endonuclease [Lysinibacillus sp. K60]|uniref:HNH endonuclease n=1 Tax=Lysinibacillus sp. K60 TaxID=2720027 RepID=UPI001C8C409D|nr:HNH endonuclease [Lysinibacillus sp. K60]MBX8946037.1 hypothetical protein [Lysinibacillus sp. K60]